MVDYSRLGEWVFLGGILLGNFLIATAWAKHGFLEVGIMRPFSKTALAGFYVGFITFVLVGIWHAGNSNFNPEVTSSSVEVLLGLPFLWLVAYRYLLLPPGTFYFNQARVRVAYWGAVHYQPGKLLSDKAALLKRFPRAQATIKLLQRAIDLQKHGKKTRFIHQAISLDVNQQPSCLGNFQAYCIVCGVKASFPSHVGDDVLEGYCNSCESKLMAQRRGDKLLVSAFLAKPIRHVSLENKKNVAVAYEVLGWLYRMMEMFPEAEQAFASSAKQLNKLLSADENNEEYLRIKSLVLFREAEVAHVCDRKDKAKVLYNASLEIDLKLQDKIGATLNRQMLSQLT